MCVYIHVGHADVFWYGRAKHGKAYVAQLAERKTFNLVAQGSSPCVGILFQHGPHNWDAHNEMVLALNTLTL